MEGEYLTKAVHEEFVRRIDQENERQETRITALERAVQEISRITINVERLATNIETMSKEIARQGERLEKIEEKPSKRWDAVITGIIGAVIGALGAAFMSGVIH